MTVTTPELVGREEELAQLVSFLDGELPPAVVIEGEAGIGKTTLWRELVRAAHERDMRVLSTSGSPGETQMAFAGLADLLEPALDDVLPGLPAPQRRALEATLLLEESTPGQTGRVVSAALLTSLRDLASRGRLLVAVDDIHWLDSASVGAVAFALRRLREERITVLLTLRTDEGGVPFDLARTPFADRVQRMTIGPLTFGALRHLVQSRTDALLTRPVLRRIHETSGGNPFFALELARALARRDVPPEQGEPLPVPGDLRRLLADSVSELPAETREALLVTALLARPSADAISRATGESAEDVLRPAFDANIVELADGVIRFVHPLLRSTVHAEASSVARKGWHRRLVEVVTDVEERAQHLALASDTPDEAVAEQIEKAGTRARARGAPAVAAGLLEHAVRLTPPGVVDDLARRTIAAADARLESGDRKRAAELLERVEGLVPHGPLLADALLRLAETRDDGTVAHRIELSEEGLREAAGDGRREVDALLSLANLEHLRGERKAAVDYALRAKAVAETIGDPSVSSQVLTGLGIYETFLGTGDPVAHYMQALELEGPGGPAAHLRGGGSYFAPGTMLADWQAKNGELDEARLLLEEQHRRAFETGDEEGRLELCAHLADLESAAGRLDDAWRWVEEGLALAEESEARITASNMLCSASVVLAYRGDHARARELAEQAKAISEPDGADLLTGKARDILCFVELSAGRPGAALAEARTDGVSPGRLPFAGDKVEALIASGRTADAHESLAALEQLAALPGRRVVRLLVLRCRGLLDAATGDLDRAIETLEDAVALARELPLPLERGRTLLALGQARRRAKMKRASREALEEARSAFAEIGAQCWADRAEAELGRIGGRTRERWELTPTERRVADLVAQGLPNKEVAAALVVSVRAVEANLTRIYGKLGVRSRTELAHVLAREETAEQ